MLHSIAFANIEVLILKNTNSLTLMGMLLYDKLNANSRQPQCKVTETREGLTEELKTAAAVRPYEMGKLSSGKAAKLAGMDKVSFLKVLGKYRVAISTMEEKVKKAHRIF